MLDLGFFRIGGEAYAEANNSYGLATIQKEHVSIQGRMVVFDYADRYGEAAREMAGWIAAGRLKAKEDVVKGGIDGFPEALLMLFEGTNTGKLVLELA